MTGYQVLSQHEQDDIIVGFMLSQEKDKFCHELNLARYEKILEGLEEGDWKDRMSGLRAESIKRLAEVNSIIEATKPTMPPPKRIELAKQRLLARDSQIKG